MWLLLLSLGAGAGCWCGLAVAGWLRAPVDGLIEDFDRLKTAAIAVAEASRTVVVNGRSYRGQRSSGSEPELVELDRVVDPDRRRAS